MVVRLARAHSAWALFKAAIIELCQKVFGGEALHGDAASDGERGHAAKQKGDEYRKCEKLPLSWASRDPAFFGLGGDLPIAVGDADAQDDRVFLEKFGMANKGVALAA